MWENVNDEKVWRVVRHLYVQFCGYKSHLLYSFFVISVIAEIYVKEYRPPTFDKSKKYAVLFSV